jgi:hypothetical protein
MTTLTLVLRTHKKNETTVVMHGGSPYILKLINNDHISLVKCKDHYFNQGLNNIVNFKNLIACPNNENNENIPLNKSIYTHNMHLYTLIYLLR